jgi:hypothetical protein
VHLEVVDPIEDSSNNSSDSVSITSPITLKLSKKSRSILIEDIEDIEGGITPSVS